MDFGEEFLHIFVADSEVVLLLSFYFISDLVLFLAANLIPASLPTLFRVI